MQISHGGLSVCRFLLQPNNTHGVVFLIESCSLWLNLANNFMNFKLHPSVINEAIGHHISHNAQNAMCHKMKKIKIKIH